MLRLVVRDSQNRIEAISQKPFEARLADEIRNELGRVMGNKCRTEFLKRLVSDSCAPAQTKASDVTTDVRWSYTAQEKCFRLTVCITVKGKTWHTHSYSAQAEEDRC